MASEQDTSASLPDDLEGWVADHTAEIEPGREDVLARAIRSYRLQTNTGANTDESEDLNERDNTEDTDEPANVDDTDTGETEDTDEKDDTDNTDVGESADTDQRDNTDDTDESADIEETDLGDNPNETALTEQATNRKDAAVSDELALRLSELDARLEDLEAVSIDQRLADLEADLDSHVEDLRSRVVDVLKETRSRAPAAHDHPDLETQLTAVQADLETHTEQLSDQQSHTDEIDSTLESVAEQTDSLAETIETLESKTDTIEGNLETATETIETLESKADRLAGAVVDLRRRLGRVESHITYERALARLLETAARMGLKKADCGSCNETVMLSMLAEPACPHCRSVFEGIEAGLGIFKSASLVVADRPALEAGETPDKPFEPSGARNHSQPSEPNSQ